MKTWTEKNGAKLKKVIKDKKLKANWVAERCGIKPNTFYQIFSGKSPSKTLLILLGLTLKIDIEKDIL